MLVEVRPRLIHGGNCHESIVRLAERCGSVDTAVDKPVLISNLLPDDVNTADEVVLVIVSLNVTEREPPDGQNFITADGLKFVEIVAQGHINGTINTVKADDVREVLRRKDVLYGYFAIYAYAATNVANCLLFFHAAKILKLNEQSISTRFINLL